MPSPKPLKALLFDLDGTLIDSIELIVASLEHTLAVYEKPPAPREQLLAGIGVPLRTSLLRFAVDESEADAMVDTYREWNRAHHDALVRPFEGVAPVLDVLASRGLPMAVVTSKLVPDARRGLATCGLADHFETVLGPEDSSRHKPDPQPLLIGCERLGVRPSEAAYVGDSVHDMQAAVSAPMRAVGAGWGPFSKDLLQAAGADPILAAPSDLARLAEL